VAQLLPHHDILHMPPVGELVHPSENAPLHYPMIEAAVHELASRKVVTPGQYLYLDNDAKARAFTIASLATEDAIEKVHETLTRSLHEGWTHREFRDAVEITLEGSALSRRAIESVYRTATGSAYERGKETILESGLAVDLFPFVMDVSVPDSRRTDLCRVVTRSGIDGSNIFMRSDPEWQRLKPLRHWQCRCSSVPLSVADAARRGIVYAQQWMAEGKRPDGPKPYVNRIEAELPKGWIR
jgi:uncharacterized protein with gpF-like domain